MSLKKVITENMKGIIIDHEARKEEDIVEFYANVFVLLTEEYCQAAFLRKDLNKGLPFDYTDESFEEWKKNNLD